MTSEQANNPNEPMTIAALLRAAADGELTPEQQQRLDTHLAQNPGDAGRIEFERELREACSRAMGGVTCPAALRARVEALASNAASVEAAADQAMAARLGNRAAETSKRSFWSQHSRFVVQAMAAVLVIGVGSVFIMQSIQTASKSVLDGAPLEQVAFRNEIAQFVSAEHHRCCEEEAAEAKFVVRDASEAAEQFGELLGAPLDLPGATGPIEIVSFRGGGQCGVPGSDGISVHMRFDFDRGAGELSKVSLFIAPDRGLLPIEVGTTYRVNTKACGIAGASILVWTDGALVYYIVAEADDGGCGDLVDAMDGPDVSGLL